MFDADAFLQGAISQKGSTRVINIPPGEYLASIGKLAPKSVVAKGEDRVILEVIWDISDPGVAEVTKRENPTVRQSIWLDLTAEGNLDMSEGQNVGLNRLREALGQNTDTAWSPNDMIGHSAFVTVTHRPYEGNLYDEVSAVRGSN